MSLDLPDIDLPDLPSMPSSAASVSLSPREKAAVVVRFLLEGGSVPILNNLAEPKQADLAMAIARMASVDQPTVEAVANEFADEIERIGLSFPNGIDNTLGLLDGMISQNAANKLRKFSTGDFQGNPWEKVMLAEDERILPFLEGEAVEVAAVILAKLPVEKASSLLSMIPGDRARRITYAISLTDSVEPETVRRIGVALASQLGARPARAFDDEPVTLVGAILNRARSSTRDGVLEGLDNEDAEFAAEVRKAIFTFANIPERVSPRDVPRIQRDVSEADLTAAIAAAKDDDLKAVEFLLENISQRLADNLRDEASEKKVTTAEGEEAMMNVVNVIRDLEASGEIFLVASDEEEEE